MLRAAAARRACLALAPPARADSPAHLVPRASRAPGRRQRAQMGALYSSAASALARAAGAEGTLARARARRPLRRCGRALLRCRKRVLRALGRSAARAQP